MLTPSDWPRIPEIVRWHHERADGSGYPDSLMNEDVPMQVRIVGLADTFDAMTSQRPYREPISLGATLNDALISKIQEDPKLADVPSCRAYTSISQIEAEQVGVG